MNSHLTERLNNLANSSWRMPALVSLEIFTPLRNSVNIVLPILEPTWGLFHKSSYNLAQEMFGSEETYDQMIKILELGKDVRSKDARI